MWVLIVLLLLAAAYVSSQSTPVVSPVPVVAAGPAGDLPPATPVATPAGVVAAVALPASTPVWVTHAGSDGGGGNDISCGQYATEALLRAACEANASCKGYSIYNGRPWCMKNKIDTSYPQYPGTVFNTITR